MKTFVYPEKRLPWRIAGLQLLCLLPACQQLSDSFEETRNPRPEQPIRPEPGQSTTSTHRGSHSSSTVSVSTQTTTTTAGTEAVNKSIFETSAAGWDSIQAKLYALPGLKGRKLFFYQGFYVYDFQGGLISISLQDPDNREHIDAYVYRKGEWQREAPVKITGNIPVGELLMPLDEVRFRTISRIWAKAQEKSATIEDAQRVTHIYFNFVKRVRLKESYLSIRSPRHDYYLEFDVQGNLKKVR